MKTHMLVMLYMFVKLKKSKYVADPAYIKIESTTKQAQTTNMSAGHFILLIFFKILNNLTFLFMSKIGRYVIHKSTHKTECCTVINKIYLDG